MPFSPKYTPEQRAAITGAVLDDGHTVPAVVKVAALGELGAPFTVTPGAGYSMIAKEREARRLKEALLRPYAMADDITRRAVALCDREMRRLEALPPPLEAADRRALRDLVKILRMVEAPVDGESTTPSHGDLDDDAPPGLAARIASTTVEADATGATRNGHATATLECPRFDGHGSLGRCLLG